MTDLVTFGEGLLRYAPPRGTRLETTDSLEVAVGGAECNVSVAASLLGLDTVWVSRLPESPLGRRVVRELRGHGVETAVDWVPDGRVGTYYLERGGAPRGSEVYYDRGGVALRDAEIEDLSIGAVRDASVYFTTGITPALSETLAETTATLLATARDVDTTTAFDLNYRSKLWPVSRARSVYESLFPHIDVLVLAERDAERVFGFDGNLVSFGHSLKTEFSFETVAITRGSRGAIALHGGEVHEQPAFESESRDPVGAGDAFVGGFLASLIGGDHVSDALAYGVAAAAIKRTIDGDLAVFTPGEVESVVETADVADERGLSR